MEGYYCMRRAFLCLFILILIYCQDAVSQCLSIEWDVDSTPLEFGSAIMVVLDGGDGVFSSVSTDLSTSYFLTGDDSALGFAGIWDSYNPLPYNPNVNSFNFIPIDLGGWDEGDTFDVCLRVFDNINFDSFNDDGYFINGFMDGGGSTGFYQSESQTVIVDMINPDNVVSFVLPDANNFGNRNLSGTPLYVEAKIEPEPEQEPQPEPEPEPQPEPDPEPQPEPQPDPEPQPEPEPEPDFGQGSCPELGIELEPLPEPEIIVLPEYGYVLRSSEYWMHDRIPISCHVWEPYLTTMGSASNFGPLSVPEPSAMLLSFLGIIFLLKSVLKINRK